MFDARQRTKGSHGRGVNHGWQYPSTWRRPRVLLGTLVGLVLLALPLAAQETATAEPEAGLKARGQAFWEARIKEDYAGQYALLEPKVRRQMSLTNYIQAQGPLQYLEARIEGVTIDEAKAVLTVRTKIRIKHPLLERRNQELVVREEWVKRQGEWYRVHPQS
jgi:hypothetical protein